MYEIRDQNNEVKHWASAIDEGDAPDPRFDLFIIFDRKVTMWKLPLSGDAYEATAVARMLRQTADRIDEIARRFVARSKSTARAAAQQSDE
jgi:hypothetical protein